MHSIGILLVLHCVLKNAGGIFYFKNQGYQRFAASFGSCNVEIDEPCSSGKVLFYIYPNNSANAQIAVKATDSKLSMYYNKSKSTKVLIHGYVGNVDSKDTVPLKSVYLKKNNVNLIVVDWGELVKLPCYPTAVFGTWQAGKCVAKFLESYVEDGNFKKVHVIGFSLGAHAAAFASNQLMKKFNKRIGRITGLDPALPFFASLESSMKLDKQDGNFVDVVHTNIGVFGKIEPTGHVDFYLNGGFSQPACQSSPNVPLCSHLMAPIYFAESVANKSKGFWGIPCSSHFHYLLGFCNDYQTKDRVLMGENILYKSRGVYFVNTRSEPPFALG